MDVHVLAGSNRPAGEADHLAVAVHGGASGDLSQRYFVAARDGLAHRHSSTCLQGQCGIRRQAGFGDGYVILRMEAHGRLPKRYNVIGVRVHFSPSPVGWIPGETV
jgi:hypothetical protein